MTSRQIDDDREFCAGESAARPGSERLVAWLSAGEVAAVLSFDASRPVRNGCDRHYPVDLFALVDRDVRLDGLYDLCRSAA